MLHISDERSELAFFFFSSRRRHTRWPRDWSSDVCSSDLLEGTELSTLEFVEAVTPEVGPDPEIAPMGGSVFESLLERVGESFMFGQIDAEGAAQSMVDELGAAIS